jgi:tetratricopeptide (TPR) repeat protein
MSQPEFGHTFSSFYFRRSLSIQPNSRDALFNLACISYNNREFKSALQNFELLLEKHPEDEQVLFLLNCCKEKINKSTQIEREDTVCPEKLDLAKSFIDEPDIKDFQYQFHNDLTFVFHNINELARAYIKKGNFEGAIKRYQNGLTIDKDSPGFNYNLGMVFLWKNDFISAEKYALRALRRKKYISASASQEVKRKFRFKEVLSQKKQEIPLSQWTFDVALEEGNYFLEAYDLLGNIYFRNGNINEAIRAFKKVLDINDHDAMGHYNLGCAFHSINQFKKAEQEWKKAIRDDKNAQTLQNRANISNDNLDVKLVVTKLWISYRSHMSLGKLYFQKNLLDKALKEFKKVIEIEPGYPEVYLFLGRIHQNKNNDLEAKFYFEKFLALGGDKSKVEKLR